MTDKEKIIKELKEALDSLDITNKYRLNLIKAIEYLQEEPVSEELEEAADIYSKSVKIWNTQKKDIRDGYIPDSFKAGAQWQKEHTINNACVNSLEVKEVGISIPNIDDTLKEEGLDPESKEAKIFKESYYTTLEKLKAQKG